MAFYSQIHTSKKVRLGTVKKDLAGREFIYGAGVSANAIGAWVVFGASFVPVLTVADIQGVMGVSMSANTSATNYSWYCISGVVDALVLASFDGTNGAGVWLTSTPGSLDDTDVAGDSVLGASALTDRDTTTGMSSFFLNRPQCYDAALD